MGKIILSILSGLLIIFYIGCVTVLPIWLIRQGIKIRKLKEKEKDDEQKKIEKAELKYSQTIQKYENVINNSSDLSNERGKNNFSTAIFFISIVIALILVNTNSTSLMLCGLVVLFVGYMFITFYKGNYKKSFKDDVVTKALKEYDSNLTYDPNGSLSEQIYLTANFEGYNSYHSEDLISGIICGYKFVMADVHTKTIEENNNSVSQYRSSFEGQFASVYLTFDTGFNLSIIDNKKSIVSKNDNIEIDNSEFEEYYDVYSDDKIKAMKVLTPVVTNKILELNKEHGFRFEIKLINNQLFFRFYANDLFEPTPIESTQKEATTVAMYLEILDEIKEIVYVITEALKKA